MSTWICFAVAGFFAVPLMAAQTGAAVTATLSKAISSTTNKAGDTVVFKLGQPVKANNHVLLPSGSKLTAHLTEVKARAAASPQAELALVFDKAVSPQGVTVPVTVSIASIARPQTSSSPSDADSGSMGIPSVAAGSPSTAIEGGRPVGGLTNNPAKNKESSKATQTAGAFSLHQKNGASVISSQSSNIRLDSTTQFLLQIKPEKQ